MKTIFESVVMVADEASLFDTLSKYSPMMIVVDLSLPISAQVNIARKIKGLYPDLKFIVLSLYDEATAMDEIMGTGASGFVLKRSIATDLLLAVDEVLLGNTYISSL